MKMLFDISSTIKVTNTAHVKKVPRCKESLQGIKGISLPVDIHNQLIGRQHGQQ